MIKENRNTYIVGKEDRLRELFPMYNGGDKRKLPNGKMIMEFRPELMGNLDELKADSTIEVFTHEEIIAELDKIIEDTESNNYRGGKKLNGKHSQEISP